VLIDTENLVSSKDFGQNLKKYIAAARKGGGPVAVTEESEVVGFFVSRQEYEAMHAAAVQELLAGRMQGKTVSHDEVRQHVRDRIKRAGRS